jgi:hypothetical protein
LPHSPQWSGFEVRSLTQAPPQQFRNGAQQISPQTWFPTGHGKHAPSKQISSAAQLTPQAEQLSRLDWRSTHWPLQQDSPAAQGVVQSPQCSSSLSKSKHLPLHSVRPLLHRHLPFLQVAPVQQSLFLSQFWPTLLQSAATFGALWQAANTPTVPSRSDLIVPRREFVMVLVSVSKRRESMRSPFVSPRA